MRMEENLSDITGKILNLTVKIICLLTGERFSILKSGDHMIISCDSLKPERHNMEKILEVIKKMMELLTGEVPIRCQDVTVYFSMEEWEYLEGHKDLYKDVMMDTHEEDDNVQHDQSANLMDNKIGINEEEDEEYGVMEEPSDGHKDMMEPPNTRNPPERCPRPLYSRDYSTQEGHTIPHHHQSGDLSVPDVREEIKEEDGVMEESEILKYLFDTNMLESFCFSNPPERCPRPLYSTQEDHNYTRLYQGEDLMTIKVGGEVEVTYVRDDQQYTEEAGMTRTFIEEDTPTEISTGHAMEKPSKDRLTLSPGCKMEGEDITGNCGGEKTMSSTMDGGLHSVDRPWSPSDSEQPCTVGDGAGIQEENEFPYPQCRESFSSGMGLFLHQGTRRKNGIHTCSECGKYFLYKAHLVTHQRFHTGEKPYSCPECGKCFAQRSYLVLHQRFHNGEQPFSCPECGKCFLTKKGLVLHQRYHTGERPYACSECGKCFIGKSALVLHQRHHTGEKPYCCSECGRCFLSKGGLAAHQTHHTGVKPFSCSECGKCYRQKSELNRHKKISHREQAVCLP